jgi:hypothetical protein
VNDNLQVRPLTAKVVQESPGVFTVRTAFAAEDLDVRL